MKKERGKPLRALVNISHGRRVLKIHAARLVWQAIHGDDPGDKHVLHKCDVPLCVNPAHLYLGTNSDNIRDRVERRTHCAKGHLLTDDNIYVYPSRGGRLCKTCLRIRNLKAKQGVP